MTTFLWTLYLAVTLFCTLLVLLGAINIIKNQKLDIGQIATQVIACVLWAVWYFYFLN